MNIYKENGYENRNDYLTTLAEELDISPETVFAAVNMLGANEDFDGLVTCLQDFSGILE